MPFILALALAAAGDAPAAAAPEPAAAAPAAEAETGVAQVAPEDPAKVDWEKEFGVPKKVRDPVTGEFPVDPYVSSPANAGGSAFSGDAMARAFGGKDGIRRIVDRFVDLNTSDPRIEAIFRSHDMVRLRRTLFEQFCFLLGAGCAYTGRDMKSSHKGLGTTRADLNALVENLQRAMREAKVPFAAQNRFLAKLAPMDRDVTER
ncbi:group I truncated hemoglobin [Novosphingobium huizhouense]|uniref:group I truncated hemoglobin n=1 Tax=Novosphingobium huizhouense TaxID=2866625 RepID=UPI0021E566EE|nr:group 1 truncated hemoglobin [Novosphingobium huizhouense]